MSNWGEVDAWCCIRGIDPLALPAYRLYNILVFMLKENLDEEGQLALTSNLESMDSGLNPFQRLQVFNRPVRRSTTSTTSSTSQPTQEMSEAEAARARAQAQGKKYRVPDWYLGDQAAGKRALSMMNKLPK